MLKDLDINEDDGLQGTNKNVDSQSEKNAIQSTELRRHSRGQRPIVDNEKLVMPSKKNHLIYRAFIRGKNEEAKRLIDEVIDKNSECSCEYAFLVRALISREDGQIKESMDWLNKAISHNPFSLRLNYEIGRTHMLLGDYDRANACFQKCIEIDPNDWKYYYWRAVTLSQKFTKNQTDSIKQAQECLLLCPRMNKSVPMLMFVAKTCIQLGDIPPAIEAYKIAQELEPENLDVISHLGLLYLKIGNEDKAFSSLGKALTYDPNHILSIVAAASILQNNGDFDVALSKYRVAAVSCEDNGIIWNNIGMCFLGKGKLVASISCLKRANYLCPLDWKILFNLGIVYSAMSQFASAYNFMSSALNLNPRNKMLLMGLAIILTELNDHVNARKAYERALKMDPDDFILRLNYAVFEYRYGSMEDCRNLLNNLKAPRNIENSQFSEIKTLAERLRTSLRNLNDSQ